jgi:hypothetical protein
MTVRPANAIGDLIPSDVERIVESRIMAADLRARFLSRYPLPLMSLLTKLRRMDIAPIEGKPVRFPPGRLEIRLDEGHRFAYRRLYQHYRSFLSEMPVLRERDFDGRPIKVTTAQLEALNAAFASLSVQERGTSVFGAQEAATTRLFKKTQFLS